MIAKPCISLVTPDHTTRYAPLGGDDADALKQGEKVPTNRVDPGVFQANLQAQNPLTQVGQSNTILSSRFPEQLVTGEGLAIVEAVAFDRLA